MTTERQAIRMVREGRYVAEVVVTLTETDHEWSPLLSAQDVQKLDEVRSALRRGDVNAATKLGRVFELTPVAAE